MATYSGWKFSSFAAIFDSLLLSIPCFSVFARLFSNLKYDQHPKENADDDVELYSVPEGKNWGDLPTELKMECIQWMDFRTRWRLAQTSFKEKALVQHKKFPGAEFSVGDSVAVSRFHLDPDSTVAYLLRSNFYFELKPDDVSKIVSVMRMSTLVYLKISCNTKVFQAICKFAERCTLDTRSLNLLEASKKDLPVVAKFKALDVLDIDFRQKITLEYFVRNVEPISRATHIKLKNLHSFKSKDLIHFIEKWLANDERSASLKITMGPHTITDDFASIIRKKFEKRISKGYSSHFHIAMDNGHFIELDASRFVFWLRVTDSQE